MTNRSSPFPALDRSDVSYEKLIELERRLIAATNRGDVKWERSGDSYALTVRSGVVDVSPAGVKIYDADGVRQRQFSYATPSLYESINGWYEAMVCETLDRMLADLEAV